MRRAQEVDGGIGCLQQPVTQAGCQILPPQDRDEWRRTHLLETIPNSSDYRCRYLIQQAMTAPPAGSHKRLRSILVWPPDSMGLQFQVASSSAFPAPFLTSCSAVFAASFDEPLTSPQSLEIAALVDPSCSALYETIRLTWMVPTQKRQKFTAASL